MSCRKLATSFWEAQSSAKHELIMGMAAEVNRDIRFDDTDVARECIIEEAVSVVTWESLVKSINEGFPEN